VRRSGIDRSQHRPFRIVPERGQVSENNSKSPRSKHWGVLHEHVSGFHLANDPGEFGPKAAAGSCDSGSPTGGRNVLAGETSGDDVDATSPWVPVECPHVVEYGEFGQDSIGLAGAEDSLTIGVDLDGSNATMAEQDSAEDSPSRSGE